MILAILFSLILAAQARPGFESVNPIRLHSDGLTRLDVNSCESWHWAVETNNAQNWWKLPEECVEYVANYMDAEPFGKPTKYNTDIATVADYASQHLTTINPNSNGKDVWIFDLSETLLSNLPYYRQPQVSYGGFPYNRTAFLEWVATGQLPGLVPVVRLYNEVQAKGYKIVIISGSPEDYREVRVRNLNDVGVYGWEKLILRKESERKIPALKYKSDKRTELVNEGYKIIGNIGDQWSDLLGPSGAERNFKVPNPMYYVA